ncbi:hypothetical protein FRC04_004989 [Tulasnella sp. 424]|nr:hypothetical protein FRC04_004989 [Tulasnella sp. 424]
MAKTIIMGGGKLRYYDALADELDEDMVKSLKAQLDGILIFAGLFAGVNSAFLALTLPAMSADPADDTNALLLQLVTGGNSTIRSAEDLPSATFAPSPGIFPVNVLFSLSLTLALLSAFLAVLGQQWLVYYRKRSGGGAEHQRWEQLRRYLGAKRWRLEAILDDVLPGLLQLALVIFCVGFVAYLRTLSKTMCYVIMGPMTIAVAVLLLMGIVGAWDRIAARKLANNGKTVLANFPQKMAQRSPTFPPAWKEVWGPVIRSITRVLSPAVHTVKTVWGWVVRSVREVWGPVVHVANRALDRSGENIAHLEVIAAKRVLCTSEDFNALVYTAVNLHGMTSKESIHYFLGDETVYERLKELWEGGRHSSGFPKVLAGAFSRAFLQLIFMGESAELLIEPRYRQQYSEALLANHRDPTSLNLLMENVKILDESIDMGAEFLHTHWKDFIWLLYYCQILKVTLDEKDCRSGLFEAWLSHIIDKYSIPDDCKPHIICLVAWGVRLLNMGIVTPTAAFTLRTSDQKGEFEWVQERERVRLRARLERAQARLGQALRLGQGMEQRLEQGLEQVLAEQLERLAERVVEQQVERQVERQVIDPVKAVKELVGSVGWEKPLVPKGVSDQ